MDSQLQTESPVPWRSNDHTASISFGSPDTIVPMATFFSRKRSEGFPFIVGGLGVGPVFASFVLCRRRLVVVSSSCRRRVVVNSLPSGKALGGVFCVFLLLRPKTLTPCHGCAKWLQLVFFERVHVDFVWQAQ